MSVTLQHESSGISRPFTASPNGEFDFSLLPPGEYLILVEQFGFQPQAV